MGCDIHAHLEVKISGTWHHASMPRIKRHYILFAKMANVRNCDKNNSNYIEPIDEPRGLPDDATFLTKFASEYMGKDGHSHSYLTSDELGELIKWYDIKCSVPDKFISFEYESLGYLFGNGWTGFKQYPNDFPKQLEDTRIIFWFDN